MRKENGLLDCAEQLKGMESILAERNQVLAVMGKMMISPLLLFEMPLDRCFSDLVFL
jgi:hypothetical protein